MIVFGKKKIEKLLRRFSNITNIIQQQNIGKTLLKSDQNVQECDATKGDISTVA
jgi:hypothetical protein